MHIFDFYGESDFSNILPRNVFFLNKKDERFSENLMRSTPESVFVHLQAEAIEIYCSLSEA